MPFNRLFREESQEDANAVEDYVNEIRAKIAEKRKELEPYNTEAWAHVDELLAKKLAESFRDMMVGEPENMILARERARVVSDLREAPGVIRQQIADLAKKIREVEGAEDG